MRHPAPPLEPALAWSNYLRVRLNAQPAWGDWLQDAAREPLAPARIDAWLQELQSAAGGAEDADDPAQARARCASVLRQLRQRVFCTLMVRDLAGLAPLDEVMEGMTALADRAITEAYRVSARELAAVHGTPMESESGLPQEMLIIGMGKLGGRELNVSSDIDVITLYGDEGETTGRRPLSYHEFYGRLTRRMLALLSEVTDQGYVFRTDLRLRPDGDSGPVSWSLDALENYLVSQGREWERYAWLKARCIDARAFPGSCTRRQIEQLESLRRPFVYRKYFDFDALLALRSLREQIRDDWNRRSLRPGSYAPVLRDNVKLGEGGIREVEFIVQLFQLVRGGRMPALQTPSLAQALRVEAEAGLIDPDDARRLYEAYGFLRRVEHALQYRDDQQTHILPHAPHDWDALAAALKFDSGAALRAALDAHRKFVHTLFCDVFHLAGLPPARPTRNGNGPSGQGEPVPANGSLVPTLDAETRFMQCIQERLPDLAEQLVPRASRIFDSPRIRALSQTSRQRLAQVLPGVVDAAASTRAPADALMRLLDIIEEIAQRRVYLTLFAEYPQTLARVARMVAASEWVAHYLKRNPILLDSLIDWSSLMEPLDFAQIARQMRADLDQCVLPDGRPDIERQMNLMRDIQRQVSFHILAQDLEGALSVETVGDLLSMLADTMLAETLHRVWPLAAPDAAEAPRFAIIAYGKLGGKELGYESDLDLVFLFEDSPQNSERYVRLSRRIVTWLNSMTPSGRLYDVDLRLRPDGDAGLVAASVESFERYQREHAWTWEHQALTRARFAAGDTRIGERFEAIRRDILLLPRDPVRLAHDVIQMRRRIQAAHINRTELFDLKHDPGGMVDIEFITQYLVLLHARTHPQLLGNLGNIALLGIAAEAALIPRDLATACIEAYRMFRREQHALRLQGVDKARVESGRFTTEREGVLRLWHTVFGPYEADVTGVPPASGMASLHRFS